MKKDVITKVIYLFSAMVLTYFIFTEVKKKHAQLQRKNPDDYVNDE